MAGSWTLELRMRTTWAVSYTHLDVYKRQTQGGPLLHTIAAKAVCLQEALQPEFKAYQQQVVKNAGTLASGLMAHGVKLVSGGTDNHLMLVDLGAEGLSLIHIS